LYLNLVISITCTFRTHPKEVKLVLKYHKHFEKMIKISKNAGSASKQKQIADQMKKNPSAMINRMNPQMLQQLGGRDAVLNMMQQMKGGPGAGMPSGSGMPMPDMTAMSRMMQQMGLGGGQMPDSSTLAQMVSRYFKCYFCYFRPYSLRPPTDAADGRNDRIEFSSVNSFHP
jgi:phosphoribosylpyrophosphate synthetase